MDKTQQAIKYLEDNGYIISICHEEEIYLVASTMGYKLSKKQTTEIINTIKENAINKSSISKAIQKHIKTH